MEDCLGNESYAALHDCEDRHQAFLKLLRIELALCNYRAEHGQYPKRLEELVPDYFEELPLDPFSGKPMIYRLESNQYRLYSVGPNRIDDGGVSSPRARPDADDVLFEAPPPPASADDVQEE